MNSYINNYVKMINKENKNYDIIKVTFVDKETISGKSILREEAYYTSTTFYRRYWDIEEITPEEVFMELL